MINENEMDIYKKYLEELLSKKSIGITPKRQKLFEAFCNDASVQEKVGQIFENQGFMQNNWELRNKILDIQEQPLKLPNAMAGRYYKFSLNFKELKWLDEIISYNFENIEQFGLSFDTKTETIEGKPTMSGDFKIVLNFKVNGEAEDAPFNQKIINLIINPDPKSLWKNLDSNKNDPYWKPDNVETFSKIGEKNIVVASKRGRSHANVGSFRDDDFAFGHIDASGWSVVAVADGAGSAKLARQGSKMACEKVISYFETHFKEEVAQKLDEAIQNVHLTPDDEGAKRALFAMRYNYLCGAALSVHKELENFANTTETNLKDYHTTLIFALFKKYDFGYVLMTFGVGDCPIAVLNSDMMAVKMLNWLDVGDFGGGTRFVTMPEVFHNDNLSTRLGFQIMPDFKYLVLMTDGIYDAKFGVEANLAKISEWQAFFDDLDGQNSEQTRVELSPENENIAAELSQWMDFWSPGNHDDRTLAIIF